MRTSDVTNSIGCTEPVMAMVAEYIKKEREADNTFIVTQWCMNVRNSVVAAGTGTSVAAVSTELVATMAAIYPERELETHYSHI